MDRKKRKAVLCNRKLIPLVDKDLTVAPFMLAKYLPVICEQTWHLCDCNIWISTYCLWSQWTFKWVFPGGTSGKESVCLCRRCKQTWVRSLSWEDVWSRKWQLAPRFLPGKLHWQRSHRVGHDWATKDNLTVSTIVLTNSSF